MTPALIQRLMHTNEFSSTFDSIADKYNCHNDVKRLTRHNSESQRERSNQHSKQELSLVQRAAMVEKRGSRLLTVRLQGRPGFFLSPEKVTRRGRASFLEAITGSSTSPQMCA